MDYDHKIVSDDALGRTQLARSHYKQRDAKALGSTLLKQRHSTFYCTLRLLLLSTLQDTVKLH